MSERFDVRRRMETPAGIRYGAVDTRTGRAARLQRIPDDGADYVVDASAFANASVRLPALDHPNLVPVLELGHDADGAYAAHAYAEGETLTEHLAARGPLNVKDTLSVAQDCLFGLAALDLAGLRHGDPHPHRILVKRNEHQRLDARLSEVGIALLARPAEPVAAGAAIPWRQMAFVAPEVIAQQSADARADLHTLGCTLYFCLTGVVPFEGENEDAVAQAHLTAGPVPLLQRRRDVPPRTAEWLMALLATRPDERPASAALALQALETALGRNAESQRLHAVAPPPAWPVAAVVPAPVAAVVPAAAVLPPRRGPRALVLGGLAVIALGSGAAWAWHGAGPDFQWPWSRARPPVVAALPPAPKSVQGRFVRIEIPRGQPLSLAEVQVFSGEKNLALQGRATQSSTSAGGDAQRAIDGKTAGHYAANTTTHTTGKDAQTWWEVDLQREQPLDAVTVWNRLESNPSYTERLAGFIVIVLDTARRETFRSPPLPAPRESVRIELKSAGAGAAKR